MGVARPSSRRSCGTNPKVLLASGGFGLAQDRRTQRKIGDEHLPLWLALAFAFVLMAVAATTVLVAVLTRAGIGTATGLAAIVPVCGKLALECVRIAFRRPD
jgi:hypothetical protein